MSWTRSPDIQGWARGLLIISGAGRGLAGRGSGIGPGPAHLVPPGNHQVFPGVVFRPGIRFPIKGKHVADRELLLRLHRERKLWQSIFSLRDGATVFRT